MAKTNLKLSVFFQQSIFSKASGIKARIFEFYHALLAEFSCILFIFEFQKD